MLVHQSSRSCNMCGNSRDSEIVDLPFEEIKLSPFAVKCECGYFYEAYHYAVSYHKWKVAKAVIESTLKSIRSELSTLRGMLQENPGILRYEVEILQAEEKLNLLQGQLDDLNANPTPDYKWVD